MLGSQGPSAEVRGQTFRDLARLASGRRFLGHLHPLQGDIRAGRWALLSHEGQGVAVAGDELLGELELLLAVRRKGGVGPLAPQLAALAVIQGFGQFTPCGAAASHCGEHPRAVLVAILVRLLILG